jgi:hypothetical protein
MPDDQKGLLKRIGNAAKGFFSKADKDAQEINQAEALAYDGGSSISTLLGSGRRMARSRQQIYQKWSFMEGDAVVSSALRLHVTSALGGHETTGDVIFIEKTPETEKNKQLAGIVDEISADLAPLLNKIAYTAAYNGTAFGDAFARIYAEKGVGVRDLYVDELVRPPIVQAYERGSQTVGFVVYAGKNSQERLTVAQMARLKMPRQLWVPQNSVIEKSFRIALLEDDVDALPILPSSVGGSFLFQAEESYDNMLASLLGLVAQRWMDSIDEQMVGVNLESMTSDEQKRYLDSIIKMLQLSKERAANAVSAGQPVMERIRHIIPVSNEKQVVRMDTMNQGRSSNITIDDVMLHAKLLAGALGTDLSMLGFAELLSGGLGDGGFFRTSAQAAEHARVIRIALSDFIEWIIDVHTMHRYGMVFPAAKKPWRVNFYGSISALETERQKTEQDAMASGATLIQVIRDLRDMNASKEFIIQFLIKRMKLDEDEAKLYAQIADQPPPVGAFGNIPMANDEPPAKPAKQPAREDA